jgi:hypothetical protein
LRGRWIAAGVAALAALAGAFAYWRQHRPEWSATRAYRRLRAALRGDGMAVPESLAPMALERAARHRLPEAELSVSRLVRTYLREAYAGEPVGEPALAALRLELSRVEKAVRARRRRRRR